MRQGPIGRVALRLEVEAGPQRRADLRPLDQRRQIEARQTLHVRGQRRPPQQVQQRRALVQGHGDPGMGWELRGAYAVLLDVIYAHGGRVENDDQAVAGLLEMSVRRRRLMAASTPAAPGNAIWWPMRCWLGQPCGYKMSISDFQLDWQFPSN